MGKAMCEFTAGMTSESCAEMQAFTWNPFEQRKFCRLHCVVRKPE